MLNIALTYMWISSAEPHNLSILNFAMGITKWQGQIIAEYNLVVNGSDGLDEELVRQALINITINILN